MFLVKKHGPKTHKVQKYLGKGHMEIFENIPADCYIIFDSKDNSK